MVMSAGVAASSVSISVMQVSLFLQLFITDNSHPSQSPDIDSSGGDTATAILLT